MENTCLERVGCVQDLACDNPTTKWKIIKQGDILLTKFDGWKSGTLIMLWSLMIISFD